MGARLPLLSALLAACLLAGQVQVDADHIHRYPETPEGRNVIRYLLATGEAFVPLNTSVRPGPLPFPHSTADVEAVSITGITELWAYLDDNCTDVPVTGMNVKLTFRDAAGALLKENTSTWGYAFDGNCSSPGDFYRNNDADLNNRNNLLWWRQGRTDANGTVWGETHQEGKKLRESKPPRSLIVIPYSGARPQCSKWVWNPLPPASFYEQGTVCNPLPPSPPSPPRPPKYVYRKWKGWKGGKKRT